MPTSARLTLASGARESWAAVRDWSESIQHWRFSSAKPVHIISSAKSDANVCSYSKHKLAIAVPRTAKESCRGIGALFPVLWVPESLPMKQTWGHRGLMLCHIHWFLPPGALCTVVQRDSFLCQNHFKPRGTSNLSLCLLDLNWIQTAVSAPGSQVTILPTFFFHGFYCHNFPLQYIMENQLYCSCFNVRLVILWVGRGLVSPTVATNALILNLLPCKIKHKILNQGMTTLSWTLYRGRRLMKSWRTVVCISCSMKSSDEHENEVAQILILNSGLNQNQVEGF